jgi:MSHA biogenesis protein MshM
MYLEYFSLARHPFRITPDPSLFFPGGTHGRGVVLDALVYGITTGEGILKVVGEVGSGKTMLCRMLEERLPPSIEIVYLANPNLTARDIVYAIAFELKLEVDAGTDRLLVMQKLQQYLLQKHAADGSVVVFIEEAQGMPLETLEEIRLLSNLETHRHKLMQIVLFGQPELERKLHDKSIRQLRERITHRFELAPLTPQDVREYLHFRLRQAGCPWPQLFSPAAEKRLASASAGLTRRVNILADKALLAAYADPSMRQEPRNSAGEVQPMVLPRHVKTAIADSGYRRALQSPPWLGYGLAAVAAGVVVAFVGLQAQWFAPAQVQVQVQPAAAVPVPALAASAAMAQPMVGVDEPEVIEDVVEIAPVASEAAPVEDPVPLAEEPPPADLEQAIAVALPEAEQEPKLVNEPSAAPVNTQGLGNLTAQRMAPSQAWLAELVHRTGYTIQLYSVPTQQPRRLEAFLEALAAAQLLERSYICIISANESRPEQWLVMHDAFPGVSGARRFLAELPPQLAQYQPYIRNLDDVACAD